jgi:Superinfection immunity protein
VALGTRTLVSFFAVLGLVAFGIAASAGEGEGEGEGEGGVALAVLGFLAAMLYFAPSLVAFERGHVNAAAIFTVNFTFGWTFLGWIAALI